MSVLEVDLSFLFVVAVILIWFMIAYQFALTIFGYINYLKSIKEKKMVDLNKSDLPSCTILIPAHNEEKVLNRTSFFHSGHSKLQVAADGTIAIAEEKPAPGALPAPGSDPKGRED